MRFFKKFEIEDNFLGFSFFEFINAEITDNFYNSPRFHKDLTNIS